MLFINDIQYLSNSEATKNFLLPEIKVLFKNITKEFNDSSGVHAPISDPSNFT